MTALKEQNEWTVEDYLTAEVQSEERSEYIGGRIFAMTGGTLRHATIAAERSTAPGSSWTR